MNGNGSNRIREEDMYVNRDAHPGWPTAAERAVKAGDEVLCVNGEAEVVKVLGRTGDGSRLLELKLKSVPGAKPFFAAASNVLVPPARAAA
jgi:ribosomal protein S28E/S33